MDFNEKIEATKEQLVREFRFLDQLEGRPEETFRRHFDAVIEILQEHFSDVEQEFVQRFEGIPEAEPSLRRLAAMETSVINDVDYLKTLDVKDDSWVNLFRSLEIRIVKMLEKERQEIIPELSALEKRVS